MSAEQEPPAAKAGAGVLSEQTVVQSAVEAAGKVHQFTEVLLGEASEETSDLPDGFVFRWMSDFPSWKSVMTTLSDHEQTELMRRACSEAQTEAEANQRHMVQFKCCRPQVATS